MIMIVKTPGSQMGSPAAAEEGGEEMGGGRWESGERSEVQAKSTLTSIEFVVKQKAAIRPGESTKKKFFLELVYERPPLDCSIHQI